MSASPTVRLAYNPGPVNAYRALEAPSVRLAYHKEGDRTLSETKQQHAPLAPALLVSYVYLAGFLKHRHRYHYRDWVMDSGAFSAHNSGTEIKLQDYIDTCKRLMAEDETLTEVFALDVIGDWKASLRNCEEMWRQGVPAIPCFHAGEPWEALLDMARDYPKVALGGVAYAGGSRKLRWAEQCFARVWPKRIHGFGFGSERQIMALPWHSVDATSWETGPCRFGRWQSFGALSVRGSNQNLRAEVEWYLELERKAQFRWRNEMEVLRGLGEGPAADRSPALRLAHSAQMRPKREGKIGLEREHAARPAVRLATQQMTEAQVQRSGLAADENSPSVRLACCMDTKEGGSWGARNMKQALGREHYVGEGVPPAES
jgi:hypothetical protein